MSGRRAYRRVLRKGHRITREGLTLYFHERSGPTRVGLVVALSPRSAVTRNRVRRRLRAAAQLTVPSVGWDVVIRAGLPAASRNFQELVQAMMGAVEKVGAAR
ncbi:MAG: ribonuclease P protein component [Actinomycetota bacterium]|nr:ribonuclease P protein component [Actinomycetota bacterium]